MNPVTHYLLGWTVAQAFGRDRRQRAWMTWAGVLPDLDGLGLVAELATRDSDKPLLWWTQYHHLLCHNLGFALLVSAGAAFHTRSVRVGGAVLASVHLHLLGDLVGARGPDGYQWPIPYLLPFSGTWEWSWDGQWALNAWPNVVLTLLLLALAGWGAVRRGISPLEPMWRRGDTAVVQALRHRFGSSGGKVDPLP